MLVLLVCLWCVLFGFGFGVDTLSSDTTEKLASDVRPNIVFLLADDLGWNDVGYHASSDILTPSIDALHETGLEMAYHYVQPQCTPSRAALLTGRYPIRYGLHHDSIAPSDTFGLALTETLLPQELQRAGYETWMVGKWHLGFFAWEYTPTFRGFDKFYGFYNGAVNYDDHSREWDGVQGYDLRDGVNPTYNDDYATYYQRDKMVEYIQGRDKSKPFFLYGSFQAVHSPNQIPIGDVWKSYKGLSSRARKIHATKATIMDQAIGAIIDALKDEGIWDNTIVIFTSDNGAVYNAGSNYPLRGSKSTIWEGGIRVPSIVNGGYLKDELRGKESHALFHIVDWLPTFLELAGIEPTRGSDGIDGVSQLAVINGESSEQRTQMLIHTDPLDCQHVCGAFRYGKWKLIRDPRKTLKNERTKEGCFWTDDFAKDGASPTVQCALSQRIDTSNGECGCGTETCLFDLESDPCEEVDVSSEYPVVVEEIYALLASYNETDPDTGRNGIATPMGELWLPDTDGANPDLHGEFWGPWLYQTREPRDNDEPSELLKNGAIVEEGEGAAPVSGSNGDVAGDTAGDSASRKKGIGNDPGVTTWMLVIILAFVVVVSVHIIHANYCRNNNMVNKQATEITPFLAKCDHFTRRARNELTTSEFDS